MMLAGLTGAAAPLAGCGSLGCASPGQPARACMQGPMRVGSTTKAQVANALGSPQNVAFDRGQEEWIYTSRRTTRRLIDFVPTVSMIRAQAPDALRRLVIRFNPQGVVQGYVFTEGRTQVRFDRLASEQRVQGTLFAAAAALGSGPPRAQ